MAVTAAVPSDRVEHRLEFADGRVTTLV